MAQNSGELLSSGEQLAQTELGKALADIRTKLTKLDQAVAAMLEEGLPKLEANDPIFGICDEIEGLLYELMDYDLDTAERISGKLERIKELRGRIENPMDFVGTDHGDGNDHGLIQARMDRVRSGAIESVKTELIPSESSLANFIRGQLVKIEQAA